MSVTVQNIVDIVNDQIGDRSEDRITDEQRLRKISEAVSWAQIDLKNDHQIKSVAFEYFDTLHRYKIKESTAKLLDANMLSMPLGDDDPQFTKYSPRDLNRALSDGTNTRGYAIEWKDGEPTMIVNFNPKRKALVVGTLDSLVADGGEWKGEGDVENLDVDDIEFSQGVGSLVFDISNDTGTSTIVNDSLPQRDLASYKNISTWLLDVTIPDVDDITEITLEWGTDDSNYFTVTEDKDIFDEDFESGEKMTMAFDWENPTTVGSPSTSDIKYVAIKFTNTGSQQGIRIDNLRLVIPQDMELQYLSSVVGTDSSGNDLAVFTDVTDIPYFSGQYDDLQYPVAHKAAALLFKDLRLHDDWENAELNAQSLLDKVRKVIPASHTQPVKAFRPAGVNFSRRGRGRRF